MANTQKDMSEARRQFLARCGKYAVVTPPTVGLLLSAAEHNYAVASSGGQGGNNNSQGGNNNSQGGNSNGGRR